MDHVVAINRLSSDPRAEDIFRAAFPDWRVPDPHEAYQVPGQGDYRAARDAIIARFEEAAPGEWRDHFTVPLAG